MAYEISRKVFTCDATALVGDAVYISAADTVAFADVDDTAKFAQAVIIEKISSTTCILGGRNTVVGGLAALTAGSYYYLTGTATAGNTISTVVSEFLVGLAISTTELWICLDIVSYWNADNAPAVTRYYSMGSAAILRALTDAGVHAGTLVYASNQVEITAAETYYLDLNLPHGAIVTAFRLTSQEDGSTMSTSLGRRSNTTTGLDILAQVTSTGTMEEVTDSSIDNATIDNDGYNLFVAFNISVAGTKTMIRSIQIDYTVVRPQP